MRKCRKLTLILETTLNQVRKARIEVEVLVVSGDSFKGYVRSFDSFCIIIETRTRSGSFINMRVITTELGVKIPGLV